MGGLRVSEADKLLVHGLTVTIGEGAGAGSLIGSNCVLPGRMGQIDYSGFFQ